MSAGILQNTLNCPQVAEDVRLDQSEMQCRQAHGCKQPNCPLDDAFSLQYFDNLIEQIWKQGYGN